MFEEILNELKDTLENYPMVISFEFTRESFIIKYTEKGETFIKPFTDSVEAFKFLESL